MVRTAAKLGSSDPGHRHETRRAAAGAPGSDAERAGLERAEPAVGDSACRYAICAAGERTGRPASSVLTVRTTASTVRSVVALPGQGDQNEQVGEEPQERHRDSGRVGVTSVSP
jgi:hypothetical protein